MKTPKCTKEQTREAAVWMTLLQSPDRTDKMDRGFRRWLAAHPGNAKAFEAASTAWEAAGTLPLSPFPYHLAARGNVSTRLKPMLAAAAVLAALALTSVLLYGRYAGVATDIGEQRSLTLKDGTRVLLNTDSRVVVNYDKHRRVVELKSGEAYFDVAKRGSDWPFVVIAGGKEVYAVGTAFVVRREVDRLMVTLLEGKVTVGPKQEPAAHLIALSPGQRLILENKKPPKVDEPAVENVTSWRTGYLNLPVMPLADAVAEMNRYTRNRIRLAEPESGEIPVSGVFLAGDNVSFATAVAESYGLTMAVEEEGITLKKN